MAEEQKQKEREKYLDDFKGSPAEQRTAKSKFISEYGYEAYEELVRNSRTDVKR